MTCCWACLTCCYVALRKPSADSGRPSWAFSDPVVLWVDEDAMMDACSHSPLLVRY